MNTIINNRVFTWLRKSPFGGFRGLGFRGLGLVLVLIPLWGLGGFSCKEEGRIDYFDKNAPAPAQIDFESIDVRNTAGGAVIKYKLPADKNLLSIKAVYEIQPGVQRQTESSYFKDSLVLEGFGDTRTYDVKLYSIGMNEKASEPVTVQVKPTTPPIHLATKELRETFGGVSVRIKNPLKVNLAVVLMGDTDQLGYQSILHTFYTSAEKVDFNYRGLNAIPNNFSVYLRDRWNNLSDTIAATLTPMFEEFIPKNKWQEVLLPTDCETHTTSSFRLIRLWDEIYNNAGIMWLDPTNPLPKWATWDLGQTVILSRVKLWHRWNYEWTVCNVRKFELYGSMSPNPDGTWESWIPLGQFECVKPSPGTAVTNEDIAFARNGLEFEFEEDELFAPNPFVPVRYIRIKIVETMRQAIRDETWVQEISFWGAIQK